MTTLDIFNQIFAIIGSLLNNPIIFGLLLAFSLIPSFVGLVKHFETKGKKADKDLLSEEELTAPNSDL